MGKSTVDWNSPETFERVVASIIASGVKLDYRRFVEGLEDILGHLLTNNSLSVSHFFGCTYDTLENRLRKTKKLALQLKGEVERGERDETSGGRKSASTPATPRKPKTPKKDALANVTQGRVAKNTTPKSSKKANVKQEMIDEGNVSAITNDFDQTFAGNNFSDEANYSFDYDTSMDQGQGFGDLL